jgi:hypothetical protein
MGAATSLYHDTSGLKYATISFPPHLKTNADSLLKLIKIVSRLKIILFILCVICITLIVLIIYLLVKKKNKNK